MSTNVKIIISCWIIGFGLGTYLGSRYSKKLEKKEAVISYMNEHHRKHYSKLMLLNQPGVNINTQDSVLTSISIKYCTDIYTFNNITKQVEPPEYDINYKESKLGFIDLAGISVATLLTSMGISTFTAKEIYQLAKNDVKIAIMGGLGILAGIGVGFFVTADECDCNHEMFKAILKEPSSWTHLISPRRGVVKMDNL